LFAITQNVVGEITDPRHFYHFHFYPLNRVIVNWFCDPYMQYQSMPATCIKT